MAVVEKREAAPEPRREKFKEKPLPDEPRSDVKLAMAGGMTLRERVRRFHTDQGTVLAFTYTRLDKNGAVMRNVDGDPMVSPEHEVILIGENVARVRDVNSLVEEGRQVAAARAVDHFNGIEQLTSVMIDRVG